jgi:hypothetical protein
VVPFANESVFSLPIPEQLIDNYVDISRCIIYVIDHEILSQEKTPIDIKTQTQTHIKI